jgi:hypothetical protein
MLLEFIRQKLLTVGKKDSFFVKIKNQIRKSTDNIGELYKVNADEDGFMYI